MSLADQQWCPTSVQVTVLQARGLRAKGKSGTNDAYAVMQVGKEKYQTSVVEKSVAPVWKEEATFDLPPLHQGSGGGGGGGGGTERSTLHVHVLHRALVGPDKLLGQAVINLLQLSEDKTRNKTEWFKLLDKTGKADKDRGEVLVDIQFMRNNMTASMFDLSGAGKSRSRLGKFKDKVRGKKKESDAASTMVPSFTQVLTDSEEEAIGDGEAAAGKDEKKKKHKMKSLFSPKSNLQKNMSQSMSVLPGKNSSLSGSQSSGLNVDPSEGKKKFKFKIHKRSGSSDSKDSSSGHQKHGAAEQSNLCINGSHIYCEEPPPRTSRIGSNFSLASSGHGSMEDVPESSPPSVDSLRAVRQYSPWTEEEEEEETAEVENIKGDVGNLRREEEERIRMEEEMRRKEEEEERVRRQEEELERLAEEKRRQEEEERRRAEEEKVKKEEEERIRREEEERAREERRQEEEERVRREEEERGKLAEEKRRLEERERRRIEEEEEEKRQREEEERIRMKEEMAQEERRRREEEESTRRLEKERKLEEEKRRLEEERRMIEEEKVRKEEEERAEEERRRREEEEMVKRQEEEHEEKRRLEEEERRRREKEERIKKEEERKQEEEEEAKREKEEYERLVEEKRKLEEEEKKRIETEERIRREEEEGIRMEEERRREEEERIKMEEERRRKEEERIRIEEERRREEEEEERIRVEEERRRRKEEEEERVRRQEEELEKLAEEKRKLEEQERRRNEEEEKREREEEERIRKEEERRQEEEERARKEKEEMERLAEEGRRLEEQERRRIEEEERIRREEKAEKERKEEEKKKENKTKPKSARTKSKVAVERPAEVTSTNPFDESDSNNPFEENQSPAGLDGSTARCQSAVSSLGNKTVSTDEKDLISSQRERRTAPQPPGRNQAERPSQREQDGSTRHLAQTNKQSKGKDAKTVSVPPQRSVQMIAPLSRSPADAKNTHSLTQSSTTKGTANAAKHSKRPAPSRPRSVEEGPSSEPKTASSSDQISKAKQEPVVYGLNPFEDDEDENELTAQDDTTSANTGSTQWPPAAPQAADKDAASLTKIKSSKVAHAPPLPAKNAATSSTLISRNTEGGHVTDDAGVTVPDNGVTRSCDPESEATSPVHVKETPLQEPQPATVQGAGEEAGAKKEGPPTTSRRLQPVKPLNPLEQQSVSVVQGEIDKKSTGILCEVQKNTKVNDSGLKGPYSQLTQEELISLVLKQENQLSERNKKISELELYIDNLLVRVIEEKPSILMSLNSLKKAA